MMKVRCAWPCGWSHTEPCSHSLGITTALAFLILTRDKIAPRPPITVSASTAHTLNPRSFVVIRPYENPA